MSHIFKNIFFLWNFKSYNTSFFFLFAGVVCQVQGEYAEISYLKQTDKAGVHWVFPEEAELQQTSFEQILASGFEVNYIQSATRICCVIKKTLAADLSNELRNITANSS